MILTLINIISWTTQKPTSFWNVPTDSFNKFMDNPFKKSESKLHFTVNDTNNPTSNSFKNACLYTNVYSYIFLTATKWKQPNECLSTDDWVNKMRYIYMVEY